MVIVPRPPLVCSRKGCSELFIKAEVTGATGAMASSCFCSVWIPLRKLFVILQLLTPPLLVLNNFAGEDVATKLLSTTFQSMFPSIDVSTVELGALKRVVLIHRDSDGEMYLP